MDNGIKLTELRVEMIRQGIQTNAEMAEKCGVSRNTISNLFRGKSPSYETVQKIVAGLELDHGKAVDIFLSSALRGA